MRCALSLLTVLYLCGECTGDSPTGIRTLSLSVIAEYPHQPHYKDAIDVIQLQPSILVQCNRSLLYPLPTCVLTPTARWTAWTAAASREIKLFAALRGGLADGSQAEGGACTAATGEHAPGQRARPGVSPGVSTSATVERLFIQVGIAFSDRRKSSRAFACRHLIRQAERRVNNNSNTNKPSEHC